MPRIPPTIAIVIVALVCAASGCVTRVTIKNEPRQQVKFASAQAAQTFYEAYLENYYSVHGRGYVNAGLNWQWPYEHRTITTDNVFFNTAARTADSDRDGVISEAEAAGYAAKVHQRFTPAVSRH